MTAHEKVSFETAMAASMEKHERGVCQIAWREGMAYGRKQALEEVLRIVENSASKSESIVLIEGHLND